MVTKSASFSLVVLFFSCASLQVTSNVESVDAPTDQSVIYLEPISEVAELETRSQAIPAGNVTVYQTWQEKPYLAKKDVRREMTQRLLKRFEDNLDKSVNLPINEGSVLVGRVTVLEHKVKKTNSNFHTLACGFGVLCPPLWIYNFFPIEQTESLVLNAQVFAIPQDQIEMRLQNTPGSMGMVNTNGIKALATREINAEIMVQRGFLINVEGDVYQQAVVDVFADALFKAKGRAKAPPAPIEDSEDPVSNISYTY